MQCQGIRPKSGIFSKFSLNSPGRTRTCSRKPTAGKEPHSRRRGKDPAEGTNGDRLAVLGHPDLSLGAPSEIKPPPSHTKAFPRGKKPARPQHTHRNRAHRRLVIAKSLSGRNWGGEIWGMPTQGVRFGQRDTSALGFGEEENLPGASRREKMQHVHSEA